MKHALTALAAAAVTIGAAGGAEAKLVAFSSPTRNIGCIGEDTRGKNNFIRCDVRVHTWRAPAKPAWCTVDWGQGLDMGPLKGARFVCAGDTSLGSKNILKYGTMKRIGGIRCWSMTTGMKCQNNHGWGFKVSKQKVLRYRVKA